MTKNKRLISAALLATLLIPFQNCGSKTDSSSYSGKTGSTSTAVSATPEVTSFYTPMTVDVLQPTALTVVANGEEPFTYQWSLGGTVIPGETKAILALPEPVAATPTTDSTSYIYTVKITDNNGDFVTQDIPLTVARSAAQKLPPAFVSKSADVTGIGTCTSGTNQNPLPLAAVFTGTKLRYSWTITYTVGTNTFTDPVVMLADGSFQTNVTRFFSGTSYIAKCIDTGTYKVTATDYFGQTATATVNINH